MDDERVRPPGRDSDLAPRRRSWVDENRRVGELSQYINRIAKAAGYDGELESLPDGLVEMVDGMRRDAGGGEQCDVCLLPKLTSEEAEQFDGCTLAEIQEAVGPRCFHRGGGPCVDRAWGRVREIEETIRAATEGRPRR